MVTVGMNYHVLPGKQADFEEKFAAVIGALRAAAGHTSSTLWKDVSDDASYLITSEWADEVAFKDFIGSDAPIPGNLAANAAPLPDPVPTHAAARGPVRASAAYAHRAYLEPLPNLFSEVDSVLRPWITELGYDEGASA